MTDLVLTYLPCTLDNLVYESVIYQNKMHISYSIQNKRTSKLSTFIYLKKYLIQIKGKRHMSQQNLRSWILSSAYHMAGYTTELNLVWFLDAL